MAAPDVTSTKRCTKCSNEYLATLEYFYKGGTRLDSYCKNCRREVNREYYQSNADSLRKSGRERSHEYRQANPDYLSEYYQSNADKIREQRREYRQANTDKIRERERAYRHANIDKNRERQREYNRKYRRANPDKEKAKDHCRRARKIESGGRFTSTDIARQRNMQTDKNGKLRCWWCSKAITDYHIDHRIPLAKGGSNAPDNLCLACPQCNHSKHAKLPSEWNGRLL